MIRVGPAAVLAGKKCRDARMEIVERDGEVPWVATRGLESEACRSEHSDAHERQLFEPDERYLLGQLIDGGITSCKDRDPEVP